MDGIRSWSVLLVRLIQRAAAPLATGASLYLIFSAYGAYLRHAHVALGLLSMMLVAICVTDKTPNREKIKLFSSHIGTILVGWAVVVGILLLVGYATKESATFSRRALFTWFLLNPFAILFAQWFAQEMLVRVLDLAKGKRNVVIAGVTPVSLRLADSIVEDKALGMNLVGYFEDRSPDRCKDIKHGNILGTLAELSAYVKTHAVDVIYITLPIKHLTRTQVLLDELQDTTASVYFVPDIFVFDLIQSRVDDIHGLPVLALLETPFYGYDGALKRILDLFVASAILLLISPVMLGIAAAVKLTSPGPVIFKQRRYGLAGEQIFVYKFRTMTVTEDGDTIKQATKDDDRLTPIGGFLRRRSLDELPQFINVLQGRMSVVGPRPHAVAHNEMYRKIIKGYMIRHKVLPGITGWAQVNGCRGETKEVEEMKDRVELDLEYLRNWSIALDVKIILKTMGVLAHDPKAH